MVRVNTSKEGGELLENGSYEVRVTKTKLIHNEEKDTYRVQVSMKVLDGANEGDTVTDWLPLAENALWRTLPILRGMGVDVPKDTDDWDFDEQALVGTSFVGTFTQDTYQGNTRNQISAAKASEKKFATAAITDDIPF